MHIEKPQQQSQQRCRRQRRLGLAESAKRNGSRYCFVRIKACREQDGYGCLCCPSIISKQCAPVLGLEAEGEVQHGDGATTASHLMFIVITAQCAPVLGLEAEDVVQHGAGAAGDGAQQQHRE